MDREKVIEGLKKVWDAFNSMEHELYADYVFDALAMLKEQETDIGNLNETVKNLLNKYTEIKAIYGDSVRVVGELVRCKDCKYWTKALGGQCIRLTVNEIAHCTSPNWFCADGRRE